MKTKRKTLLSDGTPIRIGQIVTLIDDSLGGNAVGTVTQVIDRPEIDAEHELTCRCAYIAGRQDMNNKLWEAIADLRVATPEEKLKWKRRLR
jgi:hypothetical protein